MLEIVVAMEEEACELEAKEKERRELISEKSKQGHDAARLAQITDTDMQAECRWKQLKRKYITDACTAPRKADNGIVRVKYSPSGAPRMSEGII